LETWEAYPDIQYQSELLEVRYYGDWATIDTLDTAQATAPPEENVIDQSGELTSQSRSRLFLKKVAGIWEITSDDTMWESAQVNYGVKDDIKVTLSAPEQVKAGETYSALITSNMPERTLMIASIDNQELTYPYAKISEKFRTLKQRSLQRVLTANTNNRNEMVTATIGLTGITQKEGERPSVELKGIMTLVRRVNVIPITTTQVLESMQQKGQVEYSADGKVDLSKLDIENMNTDQGFEIEISP